jgi:hemolysin III
MKLKDPVSGSLHFAGAVFAAIGMVLLVKAGLGDAWKIISFSVYGATLLILYNFSTLYHWLPMEIGGPNQLLRKLDHISIYLLIAGTYTPFCLVTLRGPWGWSLLSVIWGLAIAGIALQSVYINVDRRITTSIYVGMGWIVVTAIKPLMDHLDDNGLFLLLTGGLFYSVGGVVYALKKPNISNHFGFHELWHVFVLLGSFCHFLAIWLYV